MGFKEVFNKYIQKKKEEKEEFNAMKRELRLKRRLEQSMKTPAQKELEFYQREKEKKRLDELLKKERKERKERLNKLSNPFNKKKLFIERNDLIFRKAKLF